MLCETYRHPRRYTIRTVLILVLMEDALRGVHRKRVRRARYSLNPCSNGRCSASSDLLLETVNYHSLNPCSNGRCSARHKWQPNGRSSGVLILVLMEDALREKRWKEQRLCRLCLNPCSNGRCSARAKFKTCWISVGYSAIFGKSAWFSRKKCT